MIALDQQPIEPGVSCSAGADILAWPALSRVAAVERLEATNWVVVAADLAADANAISVVAEIAVSAVGGLFPSWLPQAAGITDAAGAAPQAVRKLASRLAASSDVFGPFCEAIAVAALRDQSNARISGFSPATTLRECYKLLMRSRPGTRQAGIVLSLPGTDTLGSDQERDLIFIAEHVRFPVRLVGPGSFGLRRIASEAAQDALPPTQTMPSAPYVTPLSGRPNPLSAAETRLEKHLAQCTWAALRHWNRTVDPGPLEPPLRVDLLFEEAGIIVEIDGPEHAGAKYAADRRRDRVLQWLGYTVLRFTNDEVELDVQRIAGEIERFVLHRGKENAHGQAARTS